MNGCSQADKSTRLLFAVFLICVFVLGIIKIESYDAWTHLSLGRVIVDNRGFPENEPFSYPSLEKGFANAEWLFDVVFYLAYAAFSLYGVILLKASIVTGAVYVLLKDSLIPDKNLFASVVVLIFIVFMIRHRIVERPDIALMFFLSFSIFSLNAFVQQDKKYLYLLPLAQIVWVNMHPSITLVIIPFCAFIFGGVLHRILNRVFKLSLPFTPTNRQLAVIMLIFMIVLAASLLNPYTSYSFSAPAQLVGGTSWYADEITELQKPTWKDFKLIYFLTAAIILSFLINIRKLSLIHLSIVIPFIYIGFSGVRFMFLLGLVGAPVLVRNISAQFDMKGKIRRVFNMAVVILMVSFTALACAGVKPFAAPGKESGFGINEQFLPEQALQYLDEKNIYGRIYNTYHWGGYITWRDFPERAAFVDGRGNVPRELLESMELVRSQSDVLDRLHRKFGFNVVVLNYQELEKFFRDVGVDEDLALSSDDWALVYWDDLAMVYLKRNEEMKDIIEKDEYRFVLPANGPSSVRSKLHDKEYMSDLLAELQRNIDETGSFTAYAFLGFVYNETAQYEKAIEALLEVEDYPIISNLYNAYQGLAFAYNKTGMYDESIEYYKKAFKLKEDASVLYSTGIVYLKMDDEKRGMKYLEDALKMNSKLVSIYPILLSLYKENRDNDKYEKTLRMYESAKIHNAGEEHFEKALSAYFNKDMKLAIEEYKKSIDVNPYNPAAFNNIGYIYFDLGLFDKSHMYQKQALDLDPDYANAHYGLALVYLKWNDSGNARYHLQEYVRIEPKGFFSRKVKTELGNLPLK